MIEKARIVFKNEMHGIIEIDLFVKSESTWKEQRCRRVKCLQVFRSNFWAAKELWLYTVIGCHFIVLYLPST